MLHKLAWKENPSRVSQAEVDAFNAQLDAVEAGNPDLRFKRIAGPGSHTLACYRTPVQELMAYDDYGNLDRKSQMNVLPVHWCEELEHNQIAAGCCRHPENHDIEAWYSDEEQRELGIPNIYIFVCTSAHPHSIRVNKNRYHVRFCVGQEKDRPFWEVR